MDQISQHWYPPKMSGYTHNYPRLLAKFRHYTTSLDFTFTFLWLGGLLFKQPYNYNFFMISDLTDKINIPPTHV